MFQYNEKPGNGTMSQHMDNRTIVSIFENRIKELGDKDKILSSVYRLYEYELILSNGGKEIDESYCSKLVEEAEPAIEEMYESQNDDGSINASIYETAVLVAVSCVVSRVYDTIDPMTARECMHLGLYAAGFLMKKMDGTEDYSKKEKLALLCAFAELSRTDVEIRNAYDHSLMAGMPQKMTRQKDYKAIVNELGSEVFTSQFFAECLLPDNETISDLLSFGCLTILMDNGDYFESVTDAATKCVYASADSVLAEDEASRTTISELFVLLALIKTQYIINSEESGQGSDSQLIKVIEYNVINKKEKLGEGEKNKLNQRIQHYTTALKK